MGELAITELFEVEDINDEELYDILQDTGKTAGGLDGWEAEDMKLHEAPFANAA